MERHETKPVKVFANAFTGFVSCLAERVNYAFRTTIFISRPGT